MTRDEYPELDRRDPLAVRRKAFELPSSVAYLRKMLDVVLFAELWKCAPTFETRTAKEA